MRFIFPVEDSNFFIVNSFEHDWCFILSYGVLTAMKTVLLEKGLSLNQVIKQKPFYFLVGGNVVDWNSLQITGSSYIILPKERVTHTLFLLCYECARFLYSLGTNKLGSASLFKYLKRSSEEICW